jgi:hypothetical protein
MSRLPENPPLPHTNDPAALLREAQRLFRLVNQQVNQLSDGRIAAANNAMDFPPEGGTWAKGDKIPNRNPSVLGPEGATYIIEGWVCVESGSPGTWVERRVDVSTPPSAPAPSPTPAPAPAPSVYSQQVLAEDATLNGVSIVTTIAGYDGAGHADWIRWDGGGQYILFTFTGLSASASGDLTLRYFNYGDQTCTVSVNGAAAVRHTFTNSGGSWGELVIPNTQFASGSNTVRLDPDYSGYTYFNWAQFDQVSGGSAPPPPPPPPPAPSSPAPAPAPAPGSAPYYPFGSRLDLTSSSYPYGIKPNGGHTTTTMDNAVKACYDVWKLRRLTKSASMYCTHGIYTGQTITDAYHVAWGNSTKACVSEGIGYGMLITVIMAGYDTNAQTFFNGLYKFARARPAYGMGGGEANNYLMSWTINYDLSTGEPYNACDGDMDIALALLMAHRQWGSSGSINYYQQALNTINAMKTVRNFASNGVMLAPQNVSRVSDYMPGHFRSFKAATNDTFWDDARTNSLALAQTITTNFSPTAKLQPGFVYDALGAVPRPDTIARIDRSGIEDIFDQNSVRNPWRWATDFVWTGDTGWGNLADGIVDTLKASSGGSATAFSYAYSLDGTPRSGLYYEPTTAGCLVAGAMVDSGHQSFVNALFTQISNNFDYGYYKAELQLLPLIVASGNWWRP